MPRDVAGAARRIVDTICRELEIHTQIEEEIFYPAVRQADDELARMVDESLRKHGRMKQDILALREEPGDEGARMTRLEQDVEHGVTDEEGRMFPRLAEVMEEGRRGELGERLEERKSELAGSGGARQRQAIGKRASARRQRTSRRATGPMVRGRGRKRASTKGRSRKTGSRARGAR